jgi:hypothetical protein
MALIQCVECSKELSEKAKACPHCGCPNNQIRCPECSNFVDDAIAECPKCGYPLKGSQPKTIPTPPTPYEATKTDSGSGMGGCLTVIGAVLIIVCVFTTAGHPGARIFGMSAIFVGILGMVILKQGGKG